MSTLSLALYGEGNTDRDFLPGVIQRTAQKVLNQHTTALIEALPVIPISVPKKRGGLDILEASYKAYGMHALIVHKDGDARTYEETIEECFNPGKALVLASAEDSCETLVPIIPIREVEAWMIADRDALREVLYIKKAVQNLNLPTKAKLVEADPDPKVTFNNVVAIAESGRRQKVNRTDLYENLAQAINLERLSLVPAYQHFVEELTATLHKLNIIQTKN